MPTRSNDPKRSEEIDPQYLEGPESGSENTTWEEIGFAEFPLVTTSLKRPPFDTLEYIEQIGTDKHSDPIYKTWQIVGSAEYGLPRQPDLDVIIAILRLLEVNNYEKKLVLCTAHDICRITGLPKGGTTYQRIRAALVRLQTTSYVAKNVFVDPKTKSRVLSEGWDIVTDHRMLPDHRDGAPSDGLPPSYIAVSTPFLNRLKSGQLKPIDLGIWRQLGSKGLSKPLYHFLDKNIYKKDRYEIGLNKLGQRIGQTTRYAPSQAKRLYEKSLSRFVHLGILDRYSFEKARSPKDPVKLVVFPGPQGRRRTKTPQDQPTYQKGPKGPSQEPTAPNSAPSQSHPDELVRYFSLNQFGVQKQQIQPAERRCARAILDYAAGDLETARAIIDYAIADAKRTEFPLRNMKGILSNTYPERALADRQAALDRLKTAKKHKAAEHKLAQERDAIRKQARGRFNKLPAEELEKLTAEQRKQLAPFIRRSPEAWPDKRIQEAAADRYVSEDVEAWLKERYRAQNQP